MVDCRPGFIQESRGIFITSILAYPPAYFWGMWVILILQALASGFNAVMDKHQFHYERSVFAHWASKPGAWGDFWANWTGPESWRNKYEGFGIGWIDFLYRTAFVFITDLWHFSQFLHFTSYQVGFALCLNEWGPVLFGSALLNVITWVLILKTLHGLVFNPLFYKLLDRPAAKTNKSFYHGKRLTEQKDETAF